MSSRGKGIAQTEVTLDGGGIPVGPFRTKLVSEISTQVRHCENFDPSIGWSQHKREGRVDLLWSRFKEIYGLPDDPRTKKLFNRTANTRWQDYKTKTLKPIFDAAPDLQAAKERRPDGEIGSDIWNRLCDKFIAISDPGDNGKSKSQKCREARKSIAVDHHLGRSSIRGWSHKHLEKLGKDPSVAAIYDKAYRRIDPLDHLESFTDECHSPYQGLSNNPQVCQISADLHRVYNEHIDGGSDEASANALALQQVMGKSKALGFGSSSSRKASSRMSNLGEHYHSLEEQNMQLGAEVKNLKETLNSVLALLRQQGHSLPGATGTPDSSVAGTTRTPDSSRARDEEEDDA